MDNEILKGIGLVVVYGCMCIGIPLVLCWVWCPTMFDRSPPVDPEEPTRPGGQG
jgi:hypothetical protein